MPITVLKYKAFFLSSTYLVGSHTLPTVLLNFSYKTQGQRSSEEFQDGNSQTLKRVRGPLECGARCDGRDHRSIRLPLAMPISQMTKLRLWGGKRQGLFPISERTVCPPHPCLLIPICTYQTPKKGLRQFR